MKGNREQIEAITKEGNLILEAGAGSGKTFVIVEHVVSRLFNFYYYQNQRKVPAERDLRRKLSSIVLMTFTNKAADEMSNRVRARILEQIELTKGSKECEYWCQCEKFIHDLVITTIHGFCYKLATEGLIQSIDFSPNLISDKQFITKIERILRLENFQIPDDSFFVQKFIFVDRKEFLKIIYSIFQNPLLRDEWINAKKEDFNFQQNIVPTMLKRYFSTLFDKTIDLSFFNQEKDKVWFKKLNFFINFFQQHAHEVDVQKLDFLLEEMKGVRIPLELKNDAQFREIWNSYEKMRKFFKENRKYFQAFQDSSNIKSFHEIFNFIKKTVLFIESHYHFFNGITFNDLEYYTWKAMESVEVSKNIQKRFEYFIIDEFQDTSFVQYLLTKLFVGEDWSKVYLVGDPKQAIYGFRGSDLMVYNRAQMEIQEKLKLKNNYRSYKKIINFNNYFFQFIFENYIENFCTPEGQVKFVFQDYPEEKEEKSEGQINYLTPQLSKTKILKKTEDICHLEALTVVNFLKTHAYAEGETITVLYKNFTPVRYLMTELINNNLSFSVQIKIPFLDSFVLGIFTYLIEGIFLDTKERSNWTQFIIHNYHHNLGVPLKNSSSSINQFYSDYAYLGLYQAFLNFLFQCDFSLLNVENDLKLLQDLTSFSYDDPHLVYSGLMELKESQVTKEIFLGDKDAKIKILTVHAAKGLEFDHVFIMGLYTNGNARSSVNKVGKSPYALWIPLDEKESSFKTPQFLLDELNEDKVEENESVRLFYVAATRSKKSLNFVKFSYNEFFQFSIPSGSWIYALDSFIERSASSHVTKVEVFIGDEVEQFRQENQRAFFHTFPVINSVIQNDLATDSLRSLIYIPDLSVTMLTSLSECSKKFYYQNVCEIDADLLGDYSQAPVLDLSNDANSSMERGTEIHKKLSLFIKNGYTYKADTETSDIFQWVQENLNFFETRQYEKISEIPLKFPFFGHMITGTPDLVLKPKSSDEEKSDFHFWDFKTGQLNENNLIGYWFQLSIYAYAYYALGHINKKNSVVVALLFVDKKIKLEKTLSYSVLEQELWQVWLGVKQLQKVNLAACSNCLYNKICPKKDS